VKFENLDDALGRLVRELENSKKDYPLYAMDFAKKLFEDRIFTFRGAEDVTGAKLPSYTPYYKKKKKKRATTWDLHGTGDLRDSIQIDNIKPGRHVQLMFNDNDEIEKANKIEQRTGQTIFEISKKEEKVILKYVADEMLRDIRRIIKESFK